MWFDILIGSTVIAITFGTSYFVVKDAIRENFKAKNIHKKIPR